MAENDSFSGISDNTNFAEINKMTISKEQINLCISLAREFGARKLILFGSGLEETGSFNDIDLACDGIAGWKLYEFGARLEELLAIPVDLVALNPPNALYKVYRKKGFYHI
jgi:predicted nucleotidyltransferase